HPERAVCSSPSGHANSGLHSPLRKQSRSILKDERRNCQTSESQFTFMGSLRNFCHGLDSYCSSEREIKQGRVVASVIAVAKLGYVLLQMAEGDFVILAPDSAL